MKRKVTAPATDSLPVGVILDALGLKGEVKVKTFTSKPDAIGRYGPLLAEDGRSFAVKTTRALKGDEMAVQFEGIDNRSSAERLKGLQLFVPRSAMPKPARNEFYHADLMGLRVEDTKGKQLGVVRGIHNFGASDVIEIALSETDTTFIPFTAEHVPMVDIAGGRLVVSDSAFWQDEPQ